MPWGRRLWVAAAAAAAFALALALQALGALRLRGPLAEPFPPGATPATVPRGSRPTVAASPRPPTATDAHTPRAPGPPREARAGVRIGGPTTGVEAPAAALIIPRAAVADGAVCLDGGPAGYYLRPGRGPNASKWVLFLEGGGWCYSPLSCIERRARWYPMGSMRGRPKRLVLKHGFGSPDPASNPDFHDWAHVFFVYCDGSSFASNREAPVPLAVSKRSNATLGFHLRGHRTLHTVLDDLLRHHGLGAAAAVVLAGHSAGAMAVVLHADAIRRRLPPTARVVGVVDAGLFVDHCDATPSARTHCRAMARAVGFWNVTSLSAACVAAEAAPWHCLLPQYAMKYVQVPLFMIQHRYDNWAVKNLLGLRWASYSNRLERHEVALVAALGRSIEAAALAVQAAAPATGLFLSRGELGVHGELLTDHWRHHRVQGATPQGALREWFGGRCAAANGCRWVEERDWAVAYRDNMTRVEQGRLDACLLPATRREVGYVQQFRPPGGCPAGAPFVLRRKGPRLVWARTNATPSAPARP